MFHQPAQILSGERSVRNHARAFGPVGDFPRFADGNDGRQGLSVKSFQIAPAPDAFFENGLERKRIKHGKNVEVKAGSPLKTYVDEDIRLGADSQTVADKKTVP